VRLERRVRLFFMLVAAVSAAALLTWFVAAERGTAPPAEKAREVSIKEASPVSSGDGGFTIVRDREAQSRTGIAVAPLEAISSGEELEAYGKVLELQSLVDLRRALINLRKNLVEARSSYVAAKARVDESAANLEASYKEYARLKILYEDDRNVSAKALEAEEGTWRSQEAAAGAAKEAYLAAQELVRSAEEALQVFQDTIRQEWGVVLASWVIDASPAFERLAQQKDFLIQITLPSEIRISSPPPSAFIETASGLTESVRLVSPAPRTDTRIQGLSFLYLAPARTALLPGMNVSARLSTGRTLAGVLVPSSAVVWWQGKAWVYLRENSDRFVRREIFTGNASREGYTVVSGFNPGEFVVVKGAQSLLSQEFPLVTQGG
jgi:hypothetical protein